MIVLVFISLITSIWYMTRRPGWSRRTPPAVQSPAGSTTGTAAVHTGTQTPHHSKQYTRGVEKSLQLDILPHPKLFKILSFLPRNFYLHPLFNHLIFFPKALKLWGRWYCFPFPFFHGILFRVVPDIRPFLISGRISSFICRISVRPENRISG